MKKVDRAICWSGSNTSWPWINHNNVNQLLVYQELTMTPSSEQGWSIKNRETTWSHDMFLSVQQHADGDLTPCCVFTVGAETPLGCPRNTLKMNVQWECFHRVCWVWFISCSLVDWTGWVSKTSAISGSTICLFMMDWKQSLRWRLVSHTYCCMFKYNQIT